MHTSDEVEREDSHIMLVRMQNGRAILKDSSAIPYKTKPTLSSDPEIVVLDIHPKELRTYVHTITCTRMFIAV